jgi:CTP synthase (UTP-ammonia lyase)
MHYERPSNRNKNMTRADSHRIGVIGDFRGTPAQVATTRAIEHAASRLDIAVDADWIATSVLREPVSEILGSCSGLFIAPGSPYENIDGVLDVIRYARTADIPLLGTCGGFQHVVLEFARNVLGIRSAHHAEYEPSAPDLVIAPLVCSLAGQRAEVVLEAGSRAAAIHQCGSTVEEYRCSFGLVREYEQALGAAGLIVSGRDASGDARILEIRNHTFFLATLFVPQLSSQAGSPHPMLLAFLTALCRRAEPKR